MAFVSFAPRSAINYLSHHSTKVDEELEKLTDPGLNKGRRCCLSPASGRACRVAVKVDVIHQQHHAAGTLKAQSNNFLSLIF
jgi:hypothetical protein